MVNDRNNASASTRATGTGDGFTLLELLVATAMTLVAIGLAMTLAAPTGIAFRALPEATDNQQRVRIAARLIADDIVGAGAGPVLGWGAAATPAWPAVLPCRWTGGPLASVAGGCARADAITLVTVAAAAPQAMVSPGADATGVLRIQSLSACGPSLAACRMHPGARALLVDGAGRWDLFLITSVSADGTEIGHAQDTLSGAVGEGALAGEASVSVYSLKTDPATGIMQLRRGTGGAQDFPVVDQVTSLSFEYFGEAAAPALVQSGAAGDSRATTYGPLPPPIGVDNPADSWPPGENCVFRLEGDRQVSRLDPLGPDALGLAPLPMAALSDGPWCPDAESPNRWDADLLRIRLVGVVLRVQPQSPVVRGSGTGGDHPVYPVEVARWVPDLEVRFGAALRNRSR